jgi:ESCRT-II complex subunit VPS22
LNEFAEKHRKKIQEVPAFRAQFHSMCLAVGVDPLKSSRSAWTTLGLGNFYAELGVQVLTVCVSTRPANGGLLPLDETVIRLRALRGGGLEVGDDDVIRAVQTLAVLGKGATIWRTGSKRYVKTVTDAFSEDQARVLEAAGRLGFVTVKSLCDELSWHDAERASFPLRAFLREGLVWEDRVPGKEVTYWFPAFIDPPPFP